MQVPYIRASVELDCSKYAYLESTNVGVDG